ncbi:creatininase family protein [Pseudohoeflea coraliihabitans]|uniref:Creatininase family protein n=1 Tax=Pseudohoeflea coraliihabitans TaxID=2860393 RepID=A0ABS6WR55_9HYPH|nr:creatininase family protein [Pseudohoeflea sp. DP4N28-3]MBW3098426.1 creatininase family protein [Pseudohoeflea sp. DP4N28-3]
MYRKIWWGDFAATEFDTIDANGTIAVVPVAAIEQHGPHLPLSTDTAIMEGMLATLIPQIPQDLDIRILPIQAVGKSNEHLYAPGTLTIPATTLIDHWLELGHSIARAGIRKLVFVTSHGGNEEIMAIVTRELRVRARMMAVKSSWSRFGLPDGLFSDTERRYGIHGGDVETSLMLHFRPELVAMDKAENFVSAVSRAEEQFDMLKHTGPFGFAWSAVDLNPSGTVGEAAEATAEKGAHTAKLQTDGFLALLQEVARARLDDWIA